MSSIKFEMLPAEPAKTIENVVDEEIDEFSRWFCEQLKNDPLVRSERSILKTYFAWKLGLVKTS